MLVGLAIDFGVHLITRFEEELRRGRPAGDAMTMALVHTGKGIVTGELTTAGAFFAMALTDFRGIREMGIITGGGLVICLVPMLTLLPVLLLRERPAPTKRTQSNGAQLPHALEAAAQPHPFRVRLEQLWLDRPWSVIGLTVALSVACLFGARGVYFDYNLLNMQSPSLPAVVFSKKLLRSNEKSVLYAAVVSEDAQKAASLESRLQPLPAVASTDSMCRYLTEDAAPKLDLARRIQQVASTIRWAEIDRSTGLPRDLNRTLWILQGYLGLALMELSKENRPDVVAELAALRNAVVGLRQAIYSDDPIQSIQRLAVFQQALFGEVHDIFQALAQQDTAGAMTVNDLPATLRDRFVGISGKHLVQVYPKRDVWDRDAQREFVEQLRTVAPDATGTPVQLLEYTGLLVQSYLEAAGWALLAIVILVYTHPLRRGEDLSHFVAKHRKVGTGFRA